MKICFSCFEGLNSPTTLNFFHLSKELSKLGNEVTLLMPKTRRSLISNKFYKRVKVKEVKIIHWTPVIKRVSQVISQSISILKENFEIIHCSKPLPQSTIPCLLYPKQVKKLVHLDDYEGYGAYLAGYNKVFSRLISIYETLILGYFDCITCVSQFLKRLAEKYTKNKEIYILPNGFDPTMFESSKNIKRRFDIDNLLVYVGGLKKTVDADLVIKIIPFVLKKVEDVKLLIVGDGPIKNELINLSKKLGVRDHVIFVGFQPHDKIPNYLMSADVLLLPFRRNVFNEARFSNKIVEYMASEKPIVTNNVGVINEILKNNISAKVVSSNSLELFANAVVELLNNKELGRKLGRNARKIAYKNFTWRQIAKKFFVVYQKCLQKKL